MIFYFKNILFYSLSLSPFMTVTAYHCDSFTTSVSEYYTVATHRQCRRQVYAT